MKFAPFIVVAVILTVGTVLEGKLSDRWGQAKSERLAEFSKRLESVPLQVGDWQGVDQPVDQEQFKLSNCDNYVSRTYTNRDGQSVNVYLVSGSARHVTIHTPDWCYVGAGYNMVYEPQQYNIEKVEGVPEVPEFLTTQFLKETPISTERIRIFWGFSDDGIWHGPRMPKPTFAGKSAMYKIYMITELDEDDTIELNPTLEFARTFLPAVHPILFGPDGAAPAKTETAAK